MKKLYITLAGLSLALSGMAQTSTEKIAGLGKFKINQTSISVIQDLEKELDVKQKKATKATDVYSSAGRKAVMELVADTISRFNGPSAATQCPTAKVYYIPTYQIAGIDIKEVYLTFQKDMLVEFKCNSSIELIEALSLKYGKPEIKKEERDATCRLSLTGNEVTLKTTTYTQKWENGTVSAVDLLSEYYDSSCKKRLISIFYIADASAVKQVYDCDKAVADRRKGAADAAKKKTLSDL